MNKWRDGQSLREPRLQSNRMISISQGLPMVSLETSAANNPHPFSHLASMRHMINSASMALLRDNSYKGLKSGTLHHLGLKNKEDKIQHSLENGRDTKIQELD